MGITGKHTIGSFLRAVYPGMPDLAAATKSETEVIMDATCELNRIRTLVIKDRDGKVVTQGAFNALECRYYEQLTDISSKDSEIAALRAEVERLLKEHRNICGALGEFYDNHEGAHTALEKIHIFKTELDTLRSRLAVLEDKLKVEHDVCMAVITVANDSEARIKELEEAIKKIYITQMYEDRKKESGVSVEMVSAVLEAADKAGCRA